MSWLIKQNKQQNKFRVWSTISDSYITKWGNRDEIIKVIIMIWMERLGEQNKELQRDFPDGWTDKDTYKIIRTNPTNNKYGKGNMAKEKYKAIDYIKARDEALASMIEFKKLGDDKMAEAYLNLAAHINAIRTDIDPIKVSGDFSLIGPTNNK